MRLKTSSKIKTELLILGNLAAQRSDVQHDACGASPHEEESLPLQVLFHQTTGIKSFPHFHCGYLHQPPAALLPQSSAHHAHGWEEFPGNRGHLAHKSSLFADRHLRLEF